MGGVDGDKTEPAEHKKLFKDGEDDLILAPRELRHCLAFISDQNARDNRHNLNKQRLEFRFTKPGELLEIE